MSNLYVYNQGAVVHYESNRLVIQDKDDLKTSMPIESVDNLIVFGGVNITTPCIKELMTRGIHVTWLSKNGAFFGRLESTEHVNIDRQRLQFRKGDEYGFRLEIAKQFLIGKTTNQRTILLRYQRIENREIIETAIARMKVLIDKMAFCESIEELIGYEGQIAKHYYSGLNAVLTEGFHFNGRSRRPPKDPFNAALSFGYTLLFYEIYSAVLSKGLNPYAGFLHSDRLKHPSLCSDLIEELRPILVDSMVVSLLNGGQLDERHFENKGSHGVFLTKEGIHVLTKSFEQRLRQEVRYIKEVSYKMSFRRIVEYQVMQVVKALEEEDPKLYKPILIR